jgi:hypothetical protein
MVATQRARYAYSPTTPGGLPIAAPGNILTAPPPPIGSSIRVLGSKKILRTNYVPEPYPEFLNLIPILAGEISWSETFESEPSGSIDFKTGWENRYLVCQLLHVGVPIELFGIGFRVSDLRMIEVPRSKSLGPIVVVSVSLSGAHGWASEDVPLVLKDFDNTETGERCDPTASKSKDVRMRSQYLSLAEIASRSGGSYSGFSGKVTVPNDAGPETSTNFMTELDARLRQNGCFKVLSEPRRIRTKKWNSVPTWQIPEGDLLKEVSRTFSGELRRSTDLSDRPFHFLPLGEQIPDLIPPFDTIPLVQEDLSKYLHSEHYFPKSEITGLFLDDSKLETKRARETTKISRFYVNPDEQTQLQNNNSNQAQWRRRARKEETTESDPNASSPPSGLGVVKTTSINFYESGSNYIKTNEKITIIDGMPFKKQTLKYGFSGIRGIDLYNPTTKKISGVNSLGFWGLIENTTEVVEYDKEGWRLRSVTTGWRTAVHQTESISDVSNEDSDPSEDFATIKFQPKTGDDATEVVFKQASLACYLPKQIQVYEIEENILSPYNAHYGDVDLPDFELQEVCSPTGELTYRRIDNIGDGKWIDPRFVRKQQRYSTAFAEAEDPRNIKISKYNSTAALADIKPEYPPLFAGSEELNFSEVKITSVKTPKWLGSVNLPPGETMADFNRSRATREEDRFLSIGKKAVAGGINFNSQLSEQTTSTNTGRPGAATQLPSVWDRIEPRSNSVDPNEQNPERGKRRYFLETTHLPPKGNKRFQRQLESSGLSYPHAETKSQAYLAAETDFRIADAQNSVREELLVWYNPQMRSGDKITYTCNGEVRRRRIFGVNNSVGIMGVVNGKPYLRTPGTSLQVGAELPVAFIRSSKLDPTANKLDPKQDLSRFQLRDLNDIGTITQSSQQSRVNSK